MVTLPGVTNLFTVLCHLVEKWYNIERAVSRVETILCIMYGEVYSSCKQEAINLQTGGMVKKLLSRVTSGGKSG